MRPKQKRIMREFRIDEISTVDDPAQEGAVATIMKNRQKQFEFEPRCLWDGNGTFKKLVGAESEEENEMTFQDLAKRVEALESVALGRHADDTLEHMPGTTDEKVALLKSMSSMPSAERATLEKMLRAGEKAVAAAFDMIGYHRGMDYAKARDFEKRAAEIRKRDNCSHTEALQKAREEHPAEFEAYQRA